MSLDKTLVDPYDIRSINTHCHPISSNLGEMHEATPAGGPYGERLLASLIDAYASLNPGRVYALVPNSSGGFRTIAMRKLASAVNYVAWWIEARIGRSDDFETLAYIGATDIRYAIFFFAAIKLGYKVWSCPLANVLRFGCRRLMA